MLQELAAFKEEAKAEYMDVSFAGHLIRIKLVNYHPITQLQTTQSVAFRAEELEMITMEHLRFCFHKWFYSKGINNG